MIIYPAVHFSNDVLKENGLNIRYILTISPYYNCRWKSSAGL